MKYEYNIVKYRVIDGDTVWTQVDLGFCICLSQSCRLIGIDAPEHSTTAGKLVTQVVDHWMAAVHDPIAVSVGWDKFAMRYDGSILPCEGVGESLNDYMIRMGLAKKYDGGKKQRWKAAELRHIESIAGSLLLTCRECHSKRAI